MTQAHPSPPVARYLLEAARLFLKLGAISFGGPAAHIALMEEEVVNKRNWLEREHFLALLAATNLVPGPNAVEMAGHIGFVHAGWPGLFVGAASFILPSVLITLGVAWIYARVGALPQVTALFYGINPAVLALVLTATYRLGRTALTDTRAILLSCACLAATLMGFEEALVLIAAGLAGSLIYRSWPKASAISVLPPSFWILSTRLPAPRFDGRLLQLGALFLKVGSLLFGSGMVLFAFIQRDVVMRYGWLTQQQLVDAIAVGQMTPGPVTSSATFIGYLVAGAPGAIVATVAMFLPSFIIVAMVGPWIPRLRQSAVAQAFLRGVNAGVVALILSIALILFRAAVVDVWTALIVGLGLVALLRFHIDSVWLVLGGAGLGFARWLITG